MTDDRKTIQRMGKQLFELKARKADLEAEVKETNAKIARLQAELAEVMLNAEVDKISLRGLGTVYVGDDFYIGVLKENREAANEWLRANGHGDIIVEYVFPQTLTAFGREMLEKGEALPEIFKITSTSVAKTRRT